MRVIKVTHYICIALLFLVTLCNASDIGSDTAVARFDTQQILDNGDRIAGFAALEEGFALKGAFVTGTFDCLFPVAGRLDLKGGSLILDKNMYLDNVSDFSMLGNITGNNHLMDLSSSVTALTSLSDDVFQCRAYALAEDATSETIRSIDWSWDSNYCAIASDIVSTTSGLWIYEFDGSTISLLATSSVSDGVTRVNDVGWHPSQYVVALARQVSSGDEVFTFSFIPSTNELVQLSSDAVANHVTAVAWHPSGDYVAFGGASNGEEIIIYPVDENGFLGIGSELRYDTGVGGRNVKDRSLDWNSTGDYLAVGYNSYLTNDELEVYEFTSSPLGLSLNASFNLGEKVEGLDWSPTYSWIFAAGVDGTGDNLVVYEHDNVPGSINQLVGVALGDQGWSPVWHPEGACLAVGGTKIGSVAKFQTYMFNKDASSLTLATEEEFSQFTRTVSWAPNGSWLAEGHTVNLSVFGLIKDHCSTFENVHINLNGPIDFRNCCIHFSGDCSINGNGNQVMLESTARLTVDDDSELHLSNMTLKGVTANRLSMGGFGSKLFFEDIEMRIVSKFKIDQGYFSVLGTVRIVGDGKEFIYESDRQSFIKSQSQLILDDGLTFSYDAPSSNLINLTTDSSELILAGATLHATGVGLELAEGILKIEDNSTLASELFTDTSGNIVDNGISLGAQGLLEDLQVIINPGIELACEQGSIRWKNVDLDALKMRSNVSHMQFLSGTTLWLHENIDVRPGSIVFEDESRLMRAVGKNITGSIQPLGILNRGRFTP